jgi:hypothetical protein
MTTYDLVGKTVNEFADEDEMREAVDAALNDIEAKVIKTFSVSWISKNTYTPDKPFWERGE